MKRFGMLAGEFNPEKHIHICGKLFIKQLNIKHTKHILKQYEISKHAKYVEQSNEKTRSALRMQNLIMVYVFHCEVRNFPRMLLRHFRLDNTQNKCFLVRTSAWCVRTGRSLEIAACKANETHRIRFGSLTASSLFAAVPSGRSIYVVRTLLYIYFSKAFGHFCFRLSHFSTQWGRHARQKQTCVTKM